MNTGDRIKQRRLELGLSADELALRIGKSRATIYRYENGDIENMPTPILEPLAKALYTTPAQLMGWEMDDGDVGNALVADCLEKEIDNMASLAPSEKDHFKAYINLLEINRKKVDDYTNQLLSIQQMEHDAVLWSHDNCMTFYFLYFYTYYVYYTIYLFIFVHYLS